MIENGMKPKYLDDKTIEKFNKHAQKTKQELKSILKLDLSF
jgi:hypothetical protein